MKATTGGAGDGQGIGNIPQTPPSSGHPSAGSPQPKTPVPVGQTPSPTGGGVAQGRTPDPNLHSGGGSSSAGAPSGPTATDGGGDPGGSSNVLLNVSGPTAGHGEAVGPQAVAVGPEAATQAGANPSSAPTTDASPAVTPAAGLSPGVAQAMTALPVLALTGIGATDLSPPVADQTGFGDRAPAQHIGQAAVEGEVAAHSASDGSVPTAAGAVAWLDSLAGAEASLIGSLPVDLAALEQAVDRCLDQLDAAGDGLAGLLASDGASPWLAGAMTASAAGAAACYARRRKRRIATAAAGDEAMASLWFPEPFACD